MTDKSYLERFLGKEAMWSNNQSTGIYEFTFITAGYTSWENPGTIVEVHDNIVVIEVWFDHKKKKARHSIPCSHLHITERDL